MKGRDWGIALMTSRDLPEVVALESDTLSPWSMADFVSELEHPGAAQYVARDLTTDQILGHLCARIGAGEAEIMKLAVRADSRRRGIGAALLQHFLDFLLKREVSLCHLELRASNDAALALYQKKGFIRTGFRKKYYSTPEEPAIIMTKTVT